MPGEADAVDLDPVEMPGRRLANHVYAEHRDFRKSPADLLCMPDDVRVRIQHDAPLAGVGCDRQIDGIVAMPVEEWPRRQPFRYPREYRPAENRGDAVIPGLRSGIDEQLG